MWRMRMSLIRSAVFALILLLLLLLVFLAVGTTDPNAPKFVPMHSQPKGTFTSMDYDWGGPVPIQNGRVWIQARSGRTNLHCFVYDVTNRLIVGELVHAIPIFFDSEQNRLLCEGYSLEGTWKWRLSRWLEKSSFGKRLAPRINRVEAFWVLDLKNGSAKPVGSLSQIPGAGSRFLPAPGFRYGLNRPTTSLGKHELFLCDLQESLLTRITITGNLVGWWDAHTLLVQDDASNLLLQDLVSHQTTVLLSAESISAALKSMALPGTSANLGWLSDWNGEGYDFFFTLKNEKNWGESFLLGLDHHDHALRLIKRSFKFQHLGFFDASATHYLYEGENGPPGTGGNGGVFLHDLADDSIRTLVPPDNGGQYSLARFCGDGVLYVRKKVLWRVDLNGSNNAPLFLPDGSR